MSKKFIAIITLLFALSAVPAVAFAGYVYDPITDEMVWQNDPVVNPPSDPVVNPPSDPVDVPPSVPDDSTVTLSLQDDGTVRLGSGTPSLITFGPSTDSPLLELNVPAGAANKDLNITIEKEEQPVDLPPNMGLVSPVFDLTKDDPANFDKPVALTLQVDADALAKQLVLDKINDAMISIVTRQKQEQDWQMLEAKRLVELLHEKAKENAMNDVLKERFDSIPDLAKAGEQLQLPPELLQKVKMLAEISHFSEYAVVVVHYSDIAGHWANENIKRAIEQGITNGYPDFTFKPNANVTRAEFAVMLNQALGGAESDKEPAFSDADRIPAWAKQAVAQAADAGIIGGYKDGTFRPDARITRAEMAVMIVKALKLTVDATAVPGFSDDKDIPAWAQGFAAAAKKQDVFSGSTANRFYPNVNATRAEAVTVLLRMSDRKAE